ncbi:MAG: transporter ATP-binding protein [Modestobacter sp.]|nr:transporter ATP-binding protein [Modestobacter sp.]
MTVAVEPHPTSHSGRPSDLVLRLADLRVEFATRDGAVPAVRGMDPEVRSGETVALLGESGSGKSVTARAVMGLTGPRARVEAQQMWLDGVDLQSAPSDELRRMRGARVSMVFQDALSALNPVLTTGSPPAPRAELPGCPFAPRCTWRIDRCVQERPLLVPLGAGGPAAASHRREEVRHAGR